MREQKKFHTIVVVALREKDGGGGGETRKEVEEKCSFCKKWLKIVNLNKSLDDDCEE